MDARAVVECVEQTLRVRHEVNAMVWREAGKLMPLPPPWGGWAASARMMSLGNHERSLKLLEDARRLFPGPSLGTFLLPDGVSLVASHGIGPYLYDIDGSAYLDYVLGSGPLILGHAHPAVIEAVTAALRRGLTFGTLNEPIIALAEEIVRAMPGAELIKFASSGAEATFYALRLARAHTGRPKILKFEGGFHGFHDYAMQSVAPRTPTDFPEPIPDTAGIPDTVSGTVLVAPFNGLDETRAIIERHRNELAAIIVEPYQRQIPPRPGFLPGLRELATQHGIVLIFDEVVTAFRFAYGGAETVYGVTPDLTALGKIIGGGFPLAAVAGRRELLEHADPRRRGHEEYVYFSSTLNGHPIAATAGLATLSVLRQAGTYEDLTSITERLLAGVREVLGRRGVPGQAVGRTGIWHVCYTDAEVVDYRSARRSDRQLSLRVGAEMIRRGVLVHFPGQKNYVSVVHTAQDVDRTVEVFDESLRAALDAMVGPRESGPDVLRPFGPPGLLPGAENV